MKLNTITKKEEFFYHFKNDSTHEFQIFFCFTDSCLLFIINSTDNYTEVPFPAYIVIMSLSRY